MSVAPVIKLSDGEIDDRIFRFENDIFKHEQLNAAKKAIGTLHRRWRPKHRGQNKARALLLLGEARSGKSTVLESYRDANPPRITEDGVIRPVILVEAPKRPTPRQLVGLIFHALKPGYRIPRGWNTEDIIHEISMLAEEMQVAVILIDEAHHIVEHKSTEALEDAAEFIKSLLNKLPTQIVLAGLPHLGNIPKTVKLEQYAHRFVPPVRLAPYNWSTAPGRKRFKAILGMFEKQLGLPEPSHLMADAFAVRVYCATGGHIGVISKQLSEALRVALTDGRASIDAAFMGKIYKSFVAGDDEGTLLDFDAPLIEGGPDLPDDKNPYLAEGEAFRGLWREMAGARLGDSSKRTNHRTKPASAPTIFEGQR